MIDAIQSNEPQNGPGVIPFETYEELCNLNSHAARKNGILLKEAYDVAVADPATIRAMVNRHSVPVLVDMTHGLGLGYDETRARQYADNQRGVSILAVPIGDLNEQAQDAILDTVAQASPRSIYFSDNGLDGEVLLKGLAERGVDFIEHRLLDERAKPGFQEPSLSFYVFDVLHERHAEGSKKGLDDLLEHFVEVTLPTIEDPNNDVILRPGDSFSSEELDELWELYLNRFQYLGEKHPMSMEDEKKDFLELFNNPAILASLKYSDGHVVAFSYFTEDMTKLYWVNRPFVDTVSQSANPSEMVLFFPGIVADQRVAGMNASEVIARFAKEMVSIEGSARVLFENTNLSEQYVPRLVHRSISNVDGLSVSMPTKVDETKYRLIELVDRAA
jgi:hypothetical protein